MPDIPGVGCRPEGASRRTVLVCDDEAVLRKLVRATLEGAEYAVVEAADGDEAVALARTSGPDVVLLDLMMPGRSGTDVLADLRRDPATADVPVIVLTARAQAADRTAVQDAGADRYLTKPFSPLILAQVVREVLDASRGSERD
jgi:two-component system phosphate regulon response regulator PhoB